MGRASPSEKKPSEEALKEKEEFVEEKLKVAYTSYLKGARISPETIEEEYEAAKHVIEAVAKDVASGRTPQSDAVERIEDLARGTVSRLKPSDERKDKKERKKVPSKGGRKAPPEVAPPILEPVAIAEKILREYPDELLTFGVSWVCENYRRELGFVNQNLEQVTLWLIKMLREKGDRIIATAHRGTEYAAGMLLADQADRIVRDKIRVGMQYEWDKIRTFISIHYPEALEEIGGRDLQLIIMGYVYKLLDSPYVAMPEDIRKTLRKFEKFHG